MGWESAFAVALCVLALCVLALPSRLLLMGCFFCFGVEVWE